jgi:hypothetical protein
MRIYITEAPQSVDVSKYSDINFKDGVVGSSKPTKDKINPSLLADVNKAAKIAGVKGSVTTAVSGHRPGSRHEKGLAVDLAMFDGKGYGSESDAKKKEIYDKIKKFVEALSSMGYKINTERGNDKAVLWFGFPQHHHHVHVSRVSDDGTSTASDKSSDKDSKSTEDSMPKDILNKLEDKKSSTSSSYSGPNLFTALGLFENREFKNKNKIISEIDKIKGMITEGVLTNYPKLTSTSEGALSGTNTYLLDDLNTIYSNNPAMKLSLTAAQGEKNGVYVNAGNATANANLINDLYSKKQYGRTNTENKNKYAINTPQNGVYVYNNTQAATSSNSTTTTTTSSSSTTDSTTKAGGLKVDTSGEGAEMVKSALSSFLGGLGMKESTDEKTLLEEIKKIKKYL